MNRALVVAAGKVHVEAVLAQLRAHPQLTSTVFDGTVTGSPSRYVNVFHNLGSWSAQRMDGTQTDPTLTFTLHCVGSTREQAEWVGGRAVGQLLNFRPTIPGWSSWRMSHEVSQPIRLDSDATPPLFYAVEQFDLRSTPA